MSGKVSGAVWELDLPRMEKYVLLALADHADHEGRNVHPSVGLVAWKTGYSDRQVRRVLRSLEADGLLVPEAHGAGGRGLATLYRIDLAGARRLLPREEAAPKPGHVDQKPGHFDRRNPDMLTKNPDISRRNPDIAMSAQPSREPSREPSAAAAAAGAFERTLNGAMPRLVAKCEGLDKQLTAPWLRRVLREAEPRCGPLRRDQLGRGLDLALDQLGRSLAAGTVRSPRGLAKTLILDRLQEQRDGTDHGQTGQTGQAPEPAGQPVGAGTAARRGPAAAAAGADAGRGGSRPRGP